MDLESDPEPVKPEVHRRIQELAYERRERDRMRAGFYIEAPAPAEERVQEEATDDDEREDEDEPTPRRLGPT